MAVGYATLYGDMAGGFAVLKDVPKTLVWRLAEFRNASSPANRLDRTSTLIATAIHPPTYWRATENSTAAGSVKSSAGT
ncbi:MAG TPA: hypothetical protein P5016_13485 [Verrucomicrobiales bacterium]|nr:hypothetical protein [Verrucomicrobiales bacterium]